MHICVTKVEGGAHYCCCWNIHIERENTDIKIYFCVMDVQAILFKHQVSANCIQSTKMLTDLDDSCFQAQAQFCMVVYFDFGK